MTKNPTPEPEPESAELPERDTSLNLHQRMMTVMHRIGYIPKEGRGPESQGSYAFAKVETIKDRVREECVRAGVMLHVSMDHREVQLLPGTDSRGNARTTILVTVWGTLTFVNVDAPEDSHGVTIHGQGLDTQDKAMSKATTSAVKYGLLNAFNIPTGDDPDATEGPELSTRPSQQQYQQRQPSQQQRSPGRQREEEPPPYGGFDPGPAAMSGDGGKCPAHGKPWRSNARGYYCPTKVGDGWCDRSPDAAWIAANER